MFEGLSEVHLRLWRCSSRNRRFGRRHYLHLEAPLTQQRSVTCQQITGLKFSQRYIWGCGAAQVVTDVSEEGISFISKHHLPSNAASHVSKSPDVQIGSGALPTSYPVGAGVNRSGREADHSPPYRAGLINLLCDGKMGQNWVYMRATWNSVHGLQNE
jgi:hypothetical protein